MADEGKPPEPPRFPPPDDDGPAGPPSWTPPPPPERRGGYPPYYGGSGYPPPPYEYGWQPSGHWLHPLDVGRAWSAAFRLYRLNWRSMLAAVAIFIVPATIVSNLLQSFAFGSLFNEWIGYFESLRPGQAPPTLPADLLSGFAGALGLLFAGVIVVAILGLFANAAAVSIVDANYRGVPSNAGTAVRAALGRTWTLIGLWLAILFGGLAVVLIGVLISIAAAIVVGALLGGGLGAFIGLVGYVGMIAALIFVQLRWSLAVQAVICEGLGAMAALGRSWRLVAGSTWRMLGYLLLFIVLSIIVGILVGLAVSILERIVFPGAVTTTIGADGIPIPRFDPVVNFVSGVLGSATTLFLTPLWIGVLTLLYYDLRWLRHESLPERAAPSPGVPAS